MLTEQIELDGLLKVEEPRVRVWRVRLQDGDPAILVVAGPGEPLVRPAGLAAAGKERLSKCGKVRDGAKYHAAGESREGEPKLKFGHAEFNATFLDLIM